jgi:excinuclease ABC subunit C
MPFDSRLFLSTCSTLPGVYQMLDRDGNVLYVGKARDLKARLSSYFLKTVAAPKTRALVARIDAVQTTVTGSETEALLLEQALIKSLLPPYNILMRDDKSYPYIKITTSDSFPRVAFHRGPRRPGARYFGPFPGAAGVRDTLNTLEKVFRLRNCRDSFFHHRTRPCLQYEIRRCTAPCVGLVSEEDYARQVRMAADFLEGRDRVVTDELTTQMEQASQELAFERAAALRDQIAAIRSVQQRQYVDTDGGDLDIVAIAGRHGLAVIAVMMIRQGRVLGIRDWQPDTRGEESESVVMSAFLAHHYLQPDDAGLPDEVILAAAVEDEEALAEAIRFQHGKKIRFAHRVRGERRRWMQMAQQNAEQTLLSRLANRENLDSRYAALDELLGEALEPRRIECFDISHTGGEQAVASCVVFGADGALKSDYRRFNVAPAVGGDDYAAMEEAVRRRYGRLRRESGKLPGLLLIDGGAGQVGRVAAVLAELGLIDELILLGIAKGPSRKPGLEVLCRPDGEQLLPGADSPALHLLQQIRDEAHRFAITGHRQRRGKLRSQSSLEGIPGVGPGRRRALLNHFGGLQPLRNASVEEIARVPGVSVVLAQTIYDWLHA